MSLESASSYRNHPKLFLQWTFLTLSWSVGLFCGCFFAYTLPEHSFSLMRILPSANVSIISVLAKILFVVLITPIFFWRNHISILYVFAFLRALVFGLVHSMIDWVFGGAGWLMRILLCFSGIFCNFCLMFIWYCHLADPAGTRKSAPLILIFMVGVIAFDLCSVQPFVSALFYQS